MGRISIKMFISFHHFYSLNLAFKYSVTYSCLVNYLKTQLVKTNIYYLRVCVDRESRCNLAGCLSLQFLIRLQSSCWLRLKSFEGVTGAGASASKEAHSCWWWEVSVSHRLLTGSCILTTCTSPQVCLSSLTYSWLTPEWARRKPQYLTS